MFEAGALGFRIQMIGAQIFKKDAKEADQAVKDLGDSSEKAAKKVGPLGDQVDKSGKAAKDAKAPLDETGKATKKLGDESETAAPKVKKTSDSVEVLKAKSDAAGQTIGTMAVGIGAAVMAMAVITVASFTTFDAAMSKTNAATMATTQQQEQLGEASIQAGADSVYSATEAANAQTELSKAGVSVNDILGGALTGSLALAAAGELGVARAAEIAATTLTVFGLKGSEAGHVADLLAAGAGKAQGSVEDLSLGLDYVGVTFARLNIPLEDTVGTLALLASNGLLGEKAGTGLRSVISSLTAPVKKGAEVMAEYGINVFDAQGKFITMAGVAEELKTGLGGLDEQTRSAALGAIFGAEAASAAGILYSAGADGVEKWTENVNDQGYAAEQARIKTDNLTGDIERLGGAMDSALIKTGSVANDTLRDMVQILTGLVDWYGNLDGGIQGTVMWLGIGTGAALLLGGTFLLAVPKIVAFRSALTTLTTEMKGTAVAGGAIGLALTAAVAILGIFGAAQAEAQQKAESYGDTLDAVTGKITENSREAAIAALSVGESFAWKESDSAFTAAKKLGIGLDTMTDAALGSKKELAEVQKVLDSLGNGTYIEEAKKRGLSVEEYTEAVLIAKDAVQGESDALANSQEVWAQAEEARKSGTSATDLATVATEAETAATEAATEARDEWLLGIAEQDASFVSLGGAYDTLIQKNQDSAQATADATDSSSDSWEDYYDGFSVGLDDYLAELQTMVDNQNNWESNMILLSGKVSAGVLDELAKMGPEGAPLVADLVNASGEQLALAETLFAEKGAAATGAFSQELLDAQTVIATAAAKLGQGAADEIAAKLAAGTSTVAGIMTEYGLQVEGVNPRVNIDTLTAEERLLRLQRLLAGIGNSMDSHISNGAGGGGITEADGGVVSYYANGGLREHHTAQIAKAGAMRVWAEPETGGEAYIPLAGAKRGRSTAILADVAGQFGYQLVAAGAQSFANGSSGATASPAPKAESSRPIYMDGSLFGYLKEIANGEARIVLNEQNKGNR